MLRLQVVNELLPPSRAKEESERSLDRADPAIVEGRNAVHDLRSSTTVTNELAEALRDAGDELAAESGVRFRLARERSGAGAKSESPERNLSHRPRATA